MKRLSPTKLKVVWILCIPVAIAFVFYLPTLIHGDDPFNKEHSLSEDFVRTNSVVRSLFGDSLKVTSNNYGGSCGQVSFHSGEGGGPLGWFRYDVVGTKSNGTIVIYWQSLDKRGKGFEVLRMERFEAGKENKVIWEQK